MLNNLEVLDRKLKSQVDDFIKEIIFFPVYYYILNKINVIISSVTKQQHSWHFD